MSAEILTTEDEKEGNHESLVAISLLFESEDTK